MKTFRKEDVVGKTVIETSGTVRGKVKDIMFDLGGGVVIVVQGEDGAESRVPLSKVTGISDHVIVRADQQPGPSDTGGTSCRYCGAPKPASSIWCPACGKSQI